MKLLEIDIFAVGNFNRRFELLKIGDIFFTAGNIYNFKHNDINISNQKINFNYKNIRDEELILDIFNNNDKPLKIDKIDASYIIDKIIFEDIGAKNYRIYFGNYKATSPSYDIESFKNYIEKENKDQCTLGKLVVLKERESIKETKNYKIIFNLLIVFTSIVLIIILVRILKKK